MPNNFKMKLLSFIFLLFIVACSVQEPTQDQPKAGITLEKEHTIGQGLSRRSTTICLRDLLAGEDSGGTWTMETSIGGFSPTLTGDSPCVDFTTAPPGLHTFRYTINTLCCSTSTTVSIRKCGIVGTSTCNF